MENLDKVILPTLKPPKGFFKWCYSKIPNYKWKNKNKTILASNRENCPLIEKRLTVKSRLTFPSQPYFFAIVLVSTKRIEIQSYVFWSDVENGKQTIEYRLANIEKFCEGKHIKAHSWANHWFEGLLKNYSYMTSAYTNTFFYPNEWQKKLNKYKEFKYLNIEYADRKTLPIYQKYAGQIEFLQRINANAFVNEILFPTYQNSNGKWRKTTDMRVCTKKWLKSHKQALKNSNKVFNDFSIQEYLEKRKSKMVDGIGKYMTVYDFESVPKRVGLMKFQKWIVTNEIVFRKYKDYLNMLAELEIPISSDLIAMPRDFNKKHDELSRTITHLNKEKLVEGYNDTLSHADKYEMEIDNIAFVAPKSLREIVTEGKELNHCVGGNSYLERHREGKSIIMFVRERSNKDTPLYTLEYQDGRIVQIQGKNDRANIPKEVRTIAEEWAEKAKRA